jgi:hypothetical protein
MDPSQVSNNRNQPEKIDFSVFDFEIDVPTAGDTAEVTFHFDQPIPEGHVWHKYDAGEGWRKFSGKSRISQDRMSATLTLTDGGTGDQDGRANGVIVDPAALGAETVDSGSGSSSGSSSGGGAGGCVYNPQAGFAWSWLLLLLPAAMLRGTGRSLARKALRLDL